MTTAVDNGACSDVLSRMRLSSLLLLRIFEKLVAPFKLPGSLTQQRKVCRLQDGGMQHARELATHRAQMKRKLVDAALSEYRLIPLDASIPPYQLTVA